jgi:outer membrane lipoprotein-sorting protein
MAFKKPDKFYMKSETNMMGGVTQEIFSSGDIVWTYMPMTKMATKMDLSKIKAAGQDQSGIGGQADITDPFKGLMKDAIKYVETKETDEGKVYIFETKPDFGGQTPPGAEGHQMLPEKVIVWISTETGLPTKTVMIGKNGASMMEQTYSDFQINPEISDSIFEFTPPEGVQVMDMTQGAMNMMQQMQGSHPK